MRRMRRIFVLALVFILAGIVLTLENMRVIVGASRLWPVFVLALGGGFLMLFVQRRNTDLALLYISTVFILLGLFFFYFNYTSWARMATMWPFFLTIAGAGFLAVYAAGRDRLFLFLGISLIMLSAVFYLVFGISLQLWPLSLVAFGASLLFVNHYHVRR